MGKAVILVIAQSKRCYLQVYVLELQAYAFIFNKSSQKKCFTYFVKFQSQFQFRGKIYILYLRLYRSSRTRIRQKNEHVQSTVFSGFIFLVLHRVHIYIRETEIHWLYLLCRCYNAACGGSSMTACQSLGTNANPLHGYTRPKC